MDTAKKATLPWSNVYGVARSLLAFGTLLTLLFNDADLLFRPDGGEVNGAMGRQGLFQGSLFFLVPPEYLEMARWFSIFILLLVVSGWRPRITGVLHWWIAYSFAAATLTVDGGDQVAAVLALWLIPVTLTDGRKWHWSPPEPVGTDPRLRTLVAAQIAMSTLLFARLQVAIIYFQAGIAKLGVPEWANGTALYYWFTHPVHGMSAAVQPLVMPLLTNPLTVTLLTWGVIVLEVALFAGLTMDRRWRPFLLVLGLFFHLGIIIVHGLVSFFFSMAAALILLLRPVDEGFRTAPVLTTLWNWARSLRPVRYGVQLVPSWQGVRAFRA
jgi:antimicrobial peptide system SdpB family protein